MTADELTALDALGDPNRREILRLLEHAATSPWPRSPPPCRSAGRRCRVTCGCSRTPGWSPSRPRARGASTTCRSRGWQAVQAYLEGVWGDAAARFRLLAENTDEATPATDGDRAAAPVASTWPARSSTRSSVWTDADRHLVAARPHGDRRARCRPSSCSRGVGGRIYERTADGTEHDWGEVTAWDAAGPARLPLAPRPRPQPAPPTSTSASSPWATHATRIEIEHARLGAPRRRGRRRGGRRTRRGLAERCSRTSRRATRERRALMAQLARRTTRGS